jgi:antitoxin VapB
MWYFTAMIKMSPETEALIEAKAARAGRTPEEVVRAALVRVGDVPPWRSPVRPRPDGLTKEELIAGMEEIAMRSAARPIADHRSTDEIIGYDDFGLPR